MRKLWLLSLLVNVLCVNGQILHTESFTVILDSTKTIKGSVVPNFKFRNLKENLFEFENIADLSIKVEKNILTVANKIELAKFGPETLVSGGYTFIEYRNIIEKKFSVEFFGQVHWAEARGMERKYASGINIRWRVIKNSSLGFFFGIGTFYEYERWNFDAVPDSELLTNTAPVETENIKLGSYASFKYAPWEKIFIDLSIYYQSRYDQLFTTPRFASSSRITYQFSKHFGLSLIYQNIYDPQPTVPIDKLYNSLVSGLSITF